MIKSDLVQRVTLRNPHLYQHDVEKAINAILDKITAAIAAGGRVELRGFGAFSAKNRPARTRRNPSTGAHVLVEQNITPVFKSGKEMRQRLNRPAVPEPVATPDNSDGSADATFEISERVAD